MSSLNNNDLYSTKEARLNTLLGDISFLAQITRARVNWSKEFPNEDNLNLFTDWLYNTYGIKLLHDPMGNITAEYTVVDEHKFLMFMLKFQ